MEDELTICLVCLGLHLHLGRRPLFVHFSFVMFAEPGTTGIALNETLALDVGSPARNLKCFLPGECGCVSWSRREFSRAANLLVCLHKHLSYRSRPVQSLNRGRNGFVG